MEQSGFTLQETFSSQSEEQRRERFQHAWNRYIADWVQNIPEEKVCDQDNIPAI